VAPEELASYEIGIKSEFLDRSMKLNVTAFYYDWNWGETEQLFQKALALNPNNQVGHEFYSSYLHAMGRLDEAHANNAQVARLQHLGQASVVPN
jgi:hypothetical protein